MIGMLCWILEDCLSANGDLVHNKYISLKSMLLAEVLFVAGIRSLPLSLVNQNSN